MELSYAAGLFDGEGSVTITKPSASAPRRHRVIAQIAMTHRPTVEAVQREFGGRIQVIDQSKYNENARDRYDWRIQDAAALAFLESIRPWLITKRLAADLALDFPTGGRGKRLTRRVLTERENLRLSLREANQRGR